MHIDFAKVYTCPRCGSDNLVTRISLDVTQGPIGFWCVSADKSYSLPSGVVSENMAAAHIECKRCGNLTTGFTDLKLEQRPIMSIAVRGEVYGAHQFVVYSGWENARANAANIHQDKEIIVIDPEEGIGFLIEDRVYLKQDLKTIAEHRRDDESYRFLNIVTKTLDPEKEYSGQNFSDLLLQDKENRQGVFKPVPGEKSFFELLGEILPKEK